MDTAHAPSDSTQAESADSGACSWDPALTDLYLRHFDRLVAGLVRRFGNRTVAEDAVQDAFLTFHANRVATTPGRELGYLATAGRNNVLQWLRREGRRHDILTASAPMRSRCASAEDESLRSRDAVALTNEIAALPHQQAQVIALRHVGGMSVAETADRLGVSTGTVKTHTYRAVHTLRTALPPHLGATA